MKAVAPGKRSRSGLIAAVVVMGVLVSYPLSVGPAVWLFEHGCLEQDTVQATYAPVHWGYKKSWVISSWTDWYLEFWRR